MNYCLIVLNPPAAYQISFRSDRANSSTTYDSINLEAILKILTFYDQWPLTIFLVKKIKMVAILLCALSYFIYYIHV